MLGSTPPAQGRESLLGAAGGPALPTTSTSDAGDRGLAALADTQRIAADTEQLGMGILDQLGTQRSQLTNAIERRQEAHENLSISSRLIRQMSNRATRMKCYIYGIIFILVAAILVIVYLHWFAGGAPAHPPHLVQAVAPPPSPSLTLAPPSEPAAPPTLVGAGRVLQLAEPPSPPPLPVQRSSVGPGIILLLVVSAVCLALCAFAMPRKIVVKTFTIIGSCLLFIATVLFCALMPRDLPPSQAPPDDGTLVDGTTLLRLLLVTCSVIFALCGLVGIQMFQLAAPQRAPVVDEPEPIQLHRDVKIASAENKS